jgi:hypothetical protein
MSAVVKQKQIETIFDHDVTEDELTLLFGAPDERLTQDEYLEFRQEDHDSRYADLFRLFDLRHDSKQAEYYLSFINESDYRRCIAQAYCIH